MVFDAVDGPRIGGRIVVAIGIGEAEYVRSGCHGCRGSRGDGDGCNARNRIVNLDVVAEWCTDTHPIGGRTVQSTVSPPENRN